MVKRIDSKYQLNSVCTVTDKGSLYFGMSVIVNTIFGTDPIIYDTYIVHLKTKALFKENQITGWTPNNDI